MAVRKPTQSSDRRPARLCARIWEFLNSIPSTWDSRFAGTIERFDVPRDQIDSIVGRRRSAKCCAQPRTRDRSRSRSTSSSGGHDLYASLRIRIMA